MAHSLFALLLLPLVLAASQVNADSHLEYQCPDNLGIFPDYEDKSYYWICVNYVPFHEQCPEPLEYDARYRQCKLSVNYFLQRYQTTGRYPTSRGPGYRTSQRPNYQTSRRPGYSTPRGPNYRTSQRPNYQTSRRPGYSTPRGPNYRTSQRPNYQTSRRPGYSTPRGPNYRTSQRPVFYTTSRPSRYSTTSRGYTSRPSRYPTTPGRATPPSYTSKITAKPATTRPGYTSSYVTSRPSRYPSTPRQGTSATGYVTSRYQTTRRYSTDGYDNYWTSRYQTSPRYWFPSSPNYEFRTVNYDEDEDANDDHDEWKDEHDFDD